jgi:hypothetical protein
MRQSSPRPQALVPSPGIGPREPQPSGQAADLIASATNAVQSVGHTMNPWRYQRVPAIGWFAECAGCGARAQLTAAYSGGYRIPCWVLELPAGKCSHGNISPKEIEVTR